MTDYVTAYADPNNMYHREATGLAERLRMTTTIIEGLIRWNSNNEVPPRDCVALAAHLGLVVNVEQCDQVRDRETQEFLAQYRRRRQHNHKPSVEEMSEMRSAFGRGAKVINVITGRVTKL